MEGNFKTKYNVGDTVYFINRDSKIERGKVHTIDIRV